LQLPEGALIVFDPVTHTAQFLDEGLTQRKPPASQVSAGLNRYFPGCLDEGIWQH
jgi:hypothetical protein